MNESSSVCLKNSCYHTFRHERLRYHFSDLTHGFLIASAVVSFVACPCTCFLNVMVILAVKTKRRLQTHSNILLASLALTDLMAGLVVQPLYGAMTVFMLQRKRFHEFCEVNLAFTITYTVIWHAALGHSVLISGERYFTIKYSFTHNEMLTKRRVTVLAASAWISGIFVSFFLLIVTVIPFVILNVTLLSSIIFLQVLVYKEARHHEKRILSLYVSQEAKARFKKEKKALKSTTLIIVTTLLFFVLPSGLMFVTWSLYGKKFSDSEKTTLRHFVLGLVKLSSTFNPIIYTSRNRHFLVAFIELLSKKGFQEAEEMARNLCSRSRRSAGRPEAGQDREMMELNCNQFRLPGRVSHENNIRGVQISITTATVTTCMQRNIIDNPSLKATGRPSLLNEPSKA